MIPKKIFQLTTSNVTVDEQIIRNIEFLKNNNPEWDYKLLDEEAQRNFLAEFYPKSFLQIYSSFGKGYDAARMDFFRYLLIYQFGGVYLDLKSSFKTPLSEWVLDSNSLLVSHWPNHPDSPHLGWGRHPELSPRGEFFNGVIIAPPKNPVLRDVINSVISKVSHYSPLENGVGGPAVLRLTGPVAYTLAIQSSKHVSDVVLVDFFEHGYQFSIFDGIKDHTELAKYKYGDRWNPVIKNSFLVTTYVFFRVYLIMKAKRIRRLMSVRLSKF